MNVVYSSSDSYSMVAGISMYSLLENNQSVDELNIFLIETVCRRKTKTNSQQCVKNLTVRLLLFPFPILKS